MCNVTRGEATLSRAYHTVGTREFPGESAVSHACMSLVLDEDGQDSQKSQGRRMALLRDGKYRG